MSVFFSLIYSQSLTQGYQSVMLLATLILHPVQQSNSDKMWLELKLDMLLEKTVLRMKGIVVLLLILMSLIPVLLILVDLSYVNSK